jgi:hypothetical protein
LLELAGYSTLVGFFISFAFLFGEFYFVRRHPMFKIVFGSLIGSLLIVSTIIMSTVASVGIGTLAGVRLTAASTMSFVLSVGFAVEYSVHIVVRFLHADSSYRTGFDRVHYTSKSRIGIHRNHFHCAAHSAFYIPRKKLTVSQLLFFCA